MKKIIIFVLMVAACGSKTDFYDVDFFCVDQSGSAVAGTNLKFNGEEKKTDNQGRCVFQVAFDRSNLELPLTSEKDGYKFIGPKTITLKEGYPHKRILDFFRGYHLSFKAIKIVNKSDSSWYGGVDISLNNIPLGTTNENGTLDTLIFEELDDTLNVIAKAPSNEEQHEIINWSWNEFHYPIKFEFISKKKVEKYPIRLVFRTYKISNNKKEPLPYIEIYMEGTKIGRTDNKGRLESRITIDYPGEQKRFEAKWDSVIKESIKFSAINRTYPLDFIFTETIPEDTIKPAEPKPIIIKGWKYDPSDKLVALDKRGRKTYYFLVGGINSPYRFPQNIKVGYAFNWIVCYLSTSNYDNFQLNRYKYSDAFRKLIDYVAKRKGENIIADNNLYKQIHKTWFFKMKNRDDEKEKNINPYRSFQENGIKEGDIIIIREKL